MKFHDNSPNFKVIEMQDIGLKGYG
jgi:hypothetical protein